MARRVLIGAVAVAVAIAAYFLLSRSGGSDGDPEADKAAAAERAIEARRAARRDGTIDLTPASIHGRVLDPDGLGVPDAVVSLGTRGLQLGYALTPGGPSEVRAATTDADGRYAFSPVAPGHYTISATAPTLLPGRVALNVRAGHRHDGVDVSLRRGGARLGGLVSDIGGGPVGGALVRVLPIGEGSFLDILRTPLTTRTDDDGRYAIQLVDGRYEIEVVHPDYVKADAAIAIRGGDKTRDFTLTPGGVVHGRVIDRATEQPVAAALVSFAAEAMFGGFAVPGLGQNTALTDVQGRFALRGLGSGAYAIRAIGRGFASRAPTVIEVGIAERIDDVVVYVDRAYTISGFVVDAGDRERPLAEVLVGAYNLSPGALHIAQAASAADGYFEIYGVQPGGYVVGAAGDERVVSLVGTHVTVQDRDVDDVVVALERGATLSGRVEPAARAQISLEPNTEAIGFGNLLQTAAAVLVRGHTDDEGAFSIAGVGPGTFDLVATAEDGREGRLPIEVTGDDQSGLVIELEPRAHVAGRVVDEQGQPVTDVEVEVDPVQSRDRGGFSIAATLANPGGATDDEGRFRVGGLRPGAHRVYVEHRGERLAWADDAHRDKPDEPIEVTIEGATPIENLTLVVESRNHRITGVVVGPGGQPMADAWVYASRTRGDAEAAPDADGEASDDSAGDGNGNGSGSSGGDGGSVTISVGSSGSSARTERRARDRGERRGPPRGRRRGRDTPPVLTDADGRFAIERLREGDYDVEAEGLKGNATGRVRGVHTGADVTIQLDALGGVAGQVTRNGEPVAAYLLIASGPTRRRVSISSSEGRYALKRLEPGAYTLTVTAPEGTTTAEVTIGAGDTARADMTLIAYSAVTGTVIDAMTGEPMSGLYAIATSGDSGDMGAQAMALLTGEGPRTDGEGRFRVDKLGPGEGQLWVFDGDPTRFDLIANQSFTLAPGETVDLGELRGVRAPKVPEDERGELGMILLAAPVAQWPGSGGDPPDGLDPARDYLWVASVEPGGPAAEAGIEPGARIVAIAGADVDAVGADIARRLLASETLRAGQPVPLVIEQGGKRDAVTVTPRAIAEPPPE